MKEYRVTVCLGEEGEVIIGNIFAVLFEIFLNLGKAKSITIEKR